MVAALREVMWCAESAWPALRLTHQTLPRGWAGLREMRGDLDLEMIRGNDEDSIRWLWYWRRLKASNGTWECLVIDSASLGRDSAYSLLQPRHRSVQTDQENGMRLSSAEQPTAEQV